MTQKTSKIKLKVETVEQYESAITLMYFLDDLGLKKAWQARAAVMRREGEYWDRCQHCDEPMGLHDDPCHDEDRWHKYDEDYYKDR